MVINQDNKTVWEGMLDSVSTDEFFFHASKSGNVGIVAESREAVQKTIDQLNLARLHEDRLRREHRKGR